MRILVLCLVLSACGGKKEGDKPAAGSAPAAAAEPANGHCMLMDAFGKPDQRCWEFDVYSQAKSMCDRDTRKLEAGKCPTASRIATCKGSSMVTHFYSGERGDCAACPDGKTPQWDAKLIATECKETGGKLE